MSNPDFALGRIVSEKAFEGEPRPIQIFNAAAEWLRHILVNTQAINQRQRLNGLFNFRHVGWDVGDGVGP